MRAEEDGAIVIGVREIQQAVFEYLVRRGLVDGERPHTVVFSWAMFPNEEDDEALVARVQPASQG